MSWEHPHLTREQFEERLAEMQAQEAGEEVGWWWLSFAKQREGFLGVAIVSARGGVSAIEKATRLGINPGGEVQFAQLVAALVEEKVPPEFREVLLSKEQLEELHLI